MFLMTSLLRKRLFIGYFITGFIVLSMVTVMINERCRLKELENLIIQINEAYENTNKVHLYITKLATLGESVIVWDESDYNIFHNQRFKTDSVLLEIKLRSCDFLCPVQIDSLRELLKTKEMHLFQIMKAVQFANKSDSILTNELPVIATQTVKVKTITQKKKGIAGLFGKKETIQVPYITNEIQNFNNRLVSVIDMRNNQIETYVDSLRLQNRLLNQKLYDFVSFLDNQVQLSFIERNLEVTEVKQESFRLFIVMMSIAVFIILISFLIIQSDLRKEEIIKFKLQQAIQENENLLDMRKKIILTVSHDIRGPLGNIHNCADLVSETREKRKREKYLDDIRHSCRHVLHLVNDLMDAYRINEAGNLRNDTPFYLDRFLQRISDEFSRKATSKGLILYSEHKGSNVIVKGDADKLEQVLANLLTNAIKFTSRGNVNFHSEYSEGKLRIEIRDTGIGMDEETLKRIFAPFERAAQNVNSEGFGLGLFLTKGLIKVLEGKMDVESVLGKGSMFRLELSLPETDELVEEDKSDHNTITILPKNVLVVDDDPIQLKIAEDMLGRKGISCKTCKNAREVVAALENSEYDLILTDVQMPDTDGFGLLRLLRNSDIGNSRTVPVAVMTARGDGNSGIYEKEGFVGCIHKPFNIHGLLAFLSTIISRTQVSVSGDFDFSSLLENTDDYSHMLSLVVMESEKELEEMESADRITDRETMRKIIHRMMPVWEMLGKDNILRDFQRLLHDSDSQNETVHEHAIQIMEWLKILIEETKKELKNMKILIVEDNMILCGMIEKWLQKAGYEVLTAIDEPGARSILKKNEISLVLGDVRLPEGDGISFLEWMMRSKMEVPFIVMTDYACITDAVRAIKLGAKDYLQKPVHQEQLIELVHSMLKQPVIVRKERSFVERTSEAARKSASLARRVAPSDLSVMILGPSGSGKEVIAQMIHRYSDRRDNPFVAVNCGSIPNDLQASEFFGVVKGAFTGAVADRKGHFETANGGTLFLDEVGNMPYSMQILLLRVLQEKEFNPVGSDKVKHTDVRIISATNEDMKKAVEEGRFREDLYYRLAELEIVQPPLKDCKDDILPLAEFFRKEHSGRIRVKNEGFTEEAKACMLGYDWPGNVRELNAKIKRAVIVADNALLDVCDLGLDNVDCSGNPDIRIIQEKERIRNLLDKNHGNVSKTAAELGCSRTALYKKMKKLDLK